MKKRIIIGMSGASGSIYGIRLLERLSPNPEVETHLILSRSAERTLYLETGKLAADVRQLAHFHYPFEDIGCKLASGSFSRRRYGHCPLLPSIPCPPIATGISSNLLVRAADVTLKERRKLILMVREMPFHLGHLRTMVSLAEMGAIVAPPVPAFYTNPQSVLDIVDHSVERVMDLLQLPAQDAKRWTLNMAVKANKQYIRAAFRRAWSI